MTGVDCPGKSATQRASFTSNLSGRFFSKELPFCCGPRQLSHPRTSEAGAAMPLASSKPNAPRTVVTFIAIRVPRKRNAGTSAHRLGTTCNIEQLGQDCNGIVTHTYHWYHFERGTNGNTLTLTQSM